MARHIKLKTQSENPAEEVVFAEQTPEVTVAEAPKKRGRKKAVAPVEAPLYEQSSEQPLEQAITPPSPPSLEGNQQESPQQDQPSPSDTNETAAPERHSYERKERHYQQNGKNNYKNNYQNNYNNNNNKKYRPRNSADQQIKEPEINLDDYPILENLDYQKYSRYLFAAYEHSSDPQKVISQVFCDDHNMLFINQLKQLSITELFMVAAHLKLENFESMHTQELIYAILGKHADDKGVIYGGGTLQLVEGGYGFLRSARYSYLPSSDDIYVAPSQISALRLRTGDLVQGQIRRPQPNESQKFFAILKVESINDKDAAEARRRTLFSNLTPLFPDQRITLERSSSSLDMRMMDIFSPIGKGQRALIVSPPKAGKTTILKDIANSITANHPEIKLIIFLVDERPEEVTDMQRSVHAEVVYSTFDEPADKHVKVAQMVLEKSRSLVESGYDVVILLDSITRLARAYNQVEPSTGKVLSGGIDSGALHKPKKFFGAARNIEEGGSLTIIATALVDTGSKMDDIIFEEFKGTGNMEINLDRNLANQRLYPAFDIKISGTRREDLLLNPATLEQTRMLRKVFANMSNEEIIYKISQAMKKFPSNAEFMSNLAFLQTLK
ncbi:MAG: transcription termination factor Rho [Brevinema sp.]